VNCPGCAAQMTSMDLMGRMSTPVQIDVCTACPAFWFDKYESLKLSPASTLKLMKLIGENPPSAGQPGDSLRCPRCATELLPTNDLQRSTRFRYWRCSNDHGRFIRFFEFLREKNFIRQLSAREIAELRENVQIVNCSNCGAPIDLAATSACGHCGSPLSMLDMKQPQQMMAELRRAVEPRPIDPALPLELAKAKLEVEAAFRPLETGADWWNDASSFGLVQAGLGAIARWLTRSGL
jgi:hypothetical protein